ncbi:MAG: hypothetical protein DMG98_10295 [Acidobacteria bacterium]|nr:MAG: hypothetical protein DMG98_10295 [Acidobacteriota bacterium]
MFSLDDERWDVLKGGYRVSFDPRPWLGLLESGKDRSAVWEAFWENLHHHGDVGEASYATVPHMVRIYSKLGVFDWHAFAIVACIELCRGERDNPPLPRWLEEDYSRAIHELAETGISQFLQLKDVEDVRAVLSILAIAKGARLHAKFLLEFTDDELLELESKL